MKYHIFDNKEKSEKDDNLLLFDNIIFKSGNYFKNKNSLHNLYILFYSLSN